MVFIELIESSLLDWLHVGELMADIFATAGAISHKLVFLGPLTVAIIITDGS